jgi:riboflavin biosynthesis pyrimidine reductase
MHLLPLDTGPDLDDEALTRLYTTERGTPCVRMNFVTSVDGAVEVEGYSEGLQTEADNRVFGLLRMLADGLLVGAGTLRHEGYGPVKLTAAKREWRVGAGLDPYPRMVIVSGALGLDPDAKVFTEAPVRPIVITHGAADDERREALSAVADVLVHGVDRVDLRSAMAELRQAYRLNHVLCEGGPHLFGALHAADLVDEVCLTLAPMRAGPGAGRIVAGPGDSVRWMRLAHALADRGTLLLRYVR